MHAHNCWKFISFIICSLTSIERTCVLLCVRSYTVNNLWFCCVFAQKPLWDNRKTNFFAHTIAKPLYLQLQMFGNVYVKENCYFYLKKIQTKMKKRLRPPGSRRALPGRALCVFLCTSLFNAQWEPKGRRPMLGKKLFRDRTYEALLSHPRGALYRVPM